MMRRRSLILFKRKECSSICRGKTCSHIHKYKINGCIICPFNDKCTNKKCRRFHVFNKFAELDHSIEKWISKNKINDLSQFNKLGTIDSNFFRSSNNLKNRYEFASLYTDFPVLAVYVSHKTGQNINSICCNINRVGYGRNTLSFNDLL